MYNIYLILLSSSLKHFFPFPFPLGLANILSRLFKKIFSLLGCKLEIAYFEIATHSHLATLNKTFRVCDYDLSKHSISSRKS